MKRNSMFKEIEKSQKIKEIIRETINQIQSEMPNCYENKIRTEEEFSNFLLNLFTEDNFHLCDHGEFIRKTEKGITTLKNKLKIQDLTDTTTGKDHESYFVITFEQSTGTLLSASFESNCEYLKNKLPTNFADYYINKRYTCFIRDNLNTVNAFIVSTSEKGININTDYFIGMYELKNYEAKRLSQILEHTDIGLTTSILDIETGRQYYIWNNKKDQPYLKKKTGKPQELVKA